MARNKIVAIGKNDIVNISKSIIEILNTKYRVVCVSNDGEEEIVGLPNIKVVSKKPAAFLTLRKNSYLFDGNTNKLKDFLKDFSFDTKLAFDFDGVINSYISGFSKVEDKIIDPPVEEIIPFLQYCFENFEEVVIYSSRCGKETGSKLINEYLSINGFSGTIRCVEKIDDSYLLIDDRIIDYTIVENIEEFVDNFIPWTKK